MERLTKSTVTGICTQMTSQLWKEAEISELTDPKLGVITGFQDLLEELDALGKIDLGTLPPAGAVQKDTV
ncbi:hypothetical protein JM93_03072 [Roseibium hamelinense]|uniref:Uncharacterized protein n=1 Tax=Roseibium hamelinense TaxID=150831 RepID=A0A562SVD7_9HYPH|nr:hypothetical protein [Roseibium hamelinense]MTI43213.1 hypothetical protein [Roseibium hamelinense]TWI84736.1 hypothetical protein JM93_03072 [Roseibium hamelinense]